MILHTEGIVFRAIKYGETSIITDIFTKEKGLLSYIIGGVRKKNAKISPGLFQVMSVLDLVVYHSEAQKLHRIKEVKPAILYQSIPFDIKKSSIILFMAELCSRTIQQPDPNQSLYAFLTETLAGLDQAGSGFQDHHLHFMLGLAAELGFGIQPREDRSQQFFDLREGRFTPGSPAHVDFLEPPVANLLATLINDQRTGDMNPLDRHARKAMLANLVAYFRMHIDDMKDLKSYHILTEVL